MQARGAEAALVVAETAYKDAADKAEAAVGTMNALLVRVRAAVKGIYGADSLEVQKVGLKRASDRRKPVRKPAA